MPPTSWVVMVLGLLLISDVNTKKHFKHKKTPRRGSFADQSRIKTNQPIIGILALEATGKITKDGTGQYILGSYVQMIESAGARVVPILVNQSPQQIQKLFNSINGVLYPGGHVKLQTSGYGRVGKQIYEMAIQANKQGSVFPIWAECLGLELIALLASGRGLQYGQYDKALLSHTDSKQYRQPLDLAADYKTSQLFGSADAPMINYIRKSLQAFNNHDKGVTPETYNKFPALKASFRILSTNKDRKGKEYISTLEGRQFPFFLLHWHPSKAQFSWIPGEKIDHSQEAVYVAQYLTRLFVNSARMSNHMFATPQEEHDALIKNYTPTKTEDGDVYFFKM